MALSDPNVVTMTFVAVSCHFGRIEGRPVASFRRRGAAGDGGRPSGNHTQPVSRPLRAPDRACSVRVMVEPASCTTTAWLFAENKLLLVTVAHRREINAAGARRPAHRETVVSDTIACEPAS